MTLIYDLIMDNKWDSLLEMAKNNKINYTKTYGTSQNSILHYAALQNNYKFLRYGDLSKLGTLENLRNETPLSVLAASGYSSTLIRLLDKMNHKKIINIENLIELLYNDIDIVNYFLKNKISFASDTIIEYNIIGSVHQNDIYHKIIQLIINNVKNINGDHILNAILAKKSWLYKDLMNAQFDVNIIINGKTLLYHLLEHDYKLFKELIEKGADINFINYDSNTLISLAIERKNYKCITFLLENNYDINRFNSFLQTDAMIIINADGIPEDIVEDTIEKADMNKIGFNNMTCLLLLAVKNRLSRYYKILETKELDIFIKSSSGKTVFDYVDDLPEFNNMIVNSYINHLSKLDNDKCLTNLENCKKKILKRIYKTKKSIPNSTDLHEITQIELSDDVFRGFNSDFVSSFMYLAFILKKYKGKICIPTQAEINVPKIKNKIIENIALSYYKYFPKFAPYFIIWGDKDNYHQHEKLCDYLIECKKSNERFILLKLTICNMTNFGLHANVIIIDKKYNTMERFDPYGGIKYNSSFTDLDKHLHDLGKGCINKNIVYYDPQQLFDGFGPQVFSMESVQQYRHINDPGGFCVAWGFWYIELRLLNDDVDGQEVLKIFIDKMDKTEKSFIKYIRKYATKLSNKKEHILKELGVNKSDYYQLLIDQKIIDKISNYLNEIY